MFSVNVRAKSSCDILKSVGISREIWIFSAQYGLGVALSVFVDILNPVICIMIGGILAANLYAFPAMLAATLFGTLVDFGCYFFKEQCLKAYKKKGKT